METFKMNLLALILILKFTIIKGFDNNYQAMQAVFYQQSYSPVFTAPASMRHTADRIHAEGYDLELPCKTIGALPIKYSWKINGESFKRKYRLNIRNSGTMMKIRRIRTTDSGVYTCIASNKYGNLSFSFPLKIKGRPGGRVPRFYDIGVMKRNQFTVRPVSTAVRFRCEAKSETPVQYTWLKNGKPLKRHRKRVDMVNYSMRIKKLTFSDAGNYTCMANNSYGTISFSFSLNLLRRRKGGPPRVITAKREPYIKARAGQDVSLECLELTSATLPYVSWHKWSVPVDKQVALTALSTIFSDKQTSKKHFKKLYRHIDPKFYTTFPVQETDTNHKFYDSNPWIFDNTRPYGLKLTVKNVSAADSGMYTCAASNHDGHDLAKLYLQVYE